MVVPALALVDQVFLADAFRLVGLAVPDVIPDRGQGEGERGQPLLTVHHQPAGERRLVLRRRCEHDGPQEVRVRLLSALDQIRLFPDVAPQLLELLLRPGVGPLIERHLELLCPALHEIGKDRLFRLHRGPPRRLMRSWCGNDLMASRRTAADYVGARPGGHTTGYERELRAPWRDRGPTDSRAVGGSTQRSAACSIRLSAGSALSSRPCPRAASGPGSVHAQFRPRVLIAMSCDQAPLPDVRRRCLSVRATRSASAGARSHG